MKNFPEKIWGKLGIPGGSPGIEEFPESIFSISEELFFAISSILSCEQEINIPVSIKNSVIKYLVIFCAILLFFDNY